MPRPVTGSVDRTSSGMYRARVPMPDGKRETVGIFATEDEARVACQTAVADLGLDGSERGVTLAAYAKRPGGFLDRRSGPAKTRTPAQKRVVFSWRNHIAKAPFYDRPLRSIRKEDVRRWAFRLRDKLSRSTTLGALYLLSSCMGEAEDERKIKQNPCTGIKLPRDARTDDAWTYLQRHEPALIEAAATRDEWLMIAFAWGTGLRAGEQRSLTLRDVHIDDENPHVVVRYGSPGAPTKSGKVRRVPLFGVALAALREWLRRLPAYAPANPLRLVFPRPSGKARPHSHFLGTVTVKRDDGKWRAIDRWGAIVEEAGFDRPFRWHDLRHSAASWAVSGWWDGRRWSLSEVRDLLGHHSVTMTERYAHLAGSALMDAAREHRASAALNGPRTHEKPARKPQRSDSGSAREQGRYATFLRSDDDRGRFVAQYVAAVEARDSRSAWRAAKAYAALVAADLAHASALVAEIVAGGRGTHRAMAELMGMGESAAAATCSSPTDATAAALVSTPLHTLRGRR